MADTIWNATFWQTTIVFVNMLYFSIQEIIKFSFTFPVNEYRHLEPV